MTDGSARPRRTTDERGFTLIELLVVMVTGVIIAGAAMAYMVVSSAQEDEISGRAVTARGAQVALQQLSRDLRQAMTVDASGNALHVSVSTTATTPPTTTISFSIPTPGSATTPETVTWSCQGNQASPGVCTRAVGSGGAATIITGFEGMSFWDASQNGLTPPITDPGFLGVTLAVGVTSERPGNATSPSPASVRATNPVTVQAGTELRNLP